ncbi:type 2 lanthipeptide synthetase LanM family protein [Cylindrospermum sp. FACHB-282]|uniref:type 2 lanthipeptide synthetase LanM family protein n=1 Tax=Cylindrospermum sp. FACHB-282 TaxID=2692794 RepID=UPI001F5580AD|nr:type 2 lanthipeptide synthetase LanM family protein [Cylindrospermum sp. FACHB-282]
MIAERLSPQFTVNDNAPQFENLVSSRLETWCEYVAKGDIKKFERRLLLDGLNWETVKLAIAPVCLVDKINLPAWTKTLHESIQAATVASGQEAIYGCIDPEVPIPFEELFLPFIYLARQRLVTRTGSNYYLLSDDAHNMLERSLLSALSNLGASVAELKFSSFRAVRESPLAYIFKQSQNIVNRDLYKTFINQMLHQGGLVDLYREYPVLARLIAAKTDFWVDAIEEFITHLAADYAEIQQVFQPETESGQVISVKCDLSDAHNNHHTVIIITFASGLKVVYKPKSLEIDQAFFNLLSWINEEGIDLPFKSLKVLNRCDHGWVEFVPTLPCKDEPAIERYYQRIGMLLGLLYVLKGNDCHYQNLIACGEHPILIDLETLIHPIMKEEGESEKKLNALNLASDFLHKNSVLATHLLPQWNPLLDGKLVYDLSPLGINEQQNSEYEQPIFLNINTDKMCIKHESVQIAKGDNHLPRIDGCVISPSEYIEDVVAGFEKIYCFLINHRECLVGNNSPLSRFSHQRIRYLFRATQIYASVLANALRPECLKDGIDYSIRIDVLSLPFLAGEKKSLFWPLLREELRSMAQMDIPYLSAFTDQGELFGGLSSIPFADCLIPSYPEVLTKLQTLSQEDLTLQIEVIRATFSASVANNLEGALSNCVAVTKPSPQNTAPLTQELCIQEAIAIANQIQQRAIRAEDGSAAWIGLGYMPKVERFSTQALGYSLYDGNCGISLFLAALWTVTKDEQYRQLALDSLIPLRQFVHSSPPATQEKLIQYINIGAGIGLGSMLYGLVQISKLLNEPTLLEDAQQLTSLLTPKTIAKDQELVLISGSAGAILGLLSLYQATGDAMCLELAVKSGHHIFSQGLDSSVGVKTWETTGKRLLAGFAHGAAGIAYALLRLYDITLETNFLMGAKAAIAYERSLFVPEVGNWMDLRTPDNSFMSGWSHGAAGIALARLGSLSIFNDEPIAQEIEIALNTTQKTSFDRVDRLDCGNFGIIDILLEASRQLSQPNLLHDAQQRASWVVNRARNQGSFYLFSRQQQDIYNPSFFNGVAGIGYGLLRLNYPELLPSVLLFA